MSEHHQIMGMCYPHDTVAWPLQDEIKKKKPEVTGEEVQEAIRKFQALSRAKHPELTREEVFQLHKVVCDKALILMKAKNEDYCAEGPFSNFKVSEAFGICSAEAGILQRMGDKLSRLANILKKPAKVNESEEDAILDLINYGILYLGLRRSRKA